MKDGTGTLYEKTGDLIDGQSKFNDGLAQLDKAWYKLKTAVASL